MLFAEGGFTTSLSLCMFAFPGGLCHSRDTRRSLSSCNERASPFSPVLCKTEVLFLPWRQGGMVWGPGGCSGEGDGGDGGFALPCAIPGAEGQSLQVLSQQRRRSRGSSVRGGGISFPAPSGRQEPSAGAPAPGPVPRAQLSRVFRKPGRYPTADVAADGVLLPLPSAEPGRRAEDVAQDRPCIPQGGRPRW